MLKLLSLAITSAAFLAALTPAHASYNHSATSNGAALGSANEPVAGAVVYERRLDAGVTAGSARVEFASDPVPYVLAMASSRNAFGGAQYSASGSMTYTFEVLAQPMQAVPVSFSGLFRLAIDQRNFSASSVYFGVSSGGQGAGMSANLSGGQATAINPDIFGQGPINVTWSGTTTASSGSFSGGLNFMTDAQGKAVGLVYLLAQANANGSFGASIASAYIDPRFEIDAGFLALNPSATLTLTQGVGNQIAAVPEPETAVIFLAGLAVLGFVRRRRRHALAV